MLSITSIPALACDGALNTRVIGFSEDGQTVVLRRESEVYSSEVEGSVETSIDIELFDLSTQRRSELSTVCTTQQECDKQAPDSPRKANWAQISGDLAERGFEINPHYPKATAVPALGAILELRDAPDEVTSGGFPLWAIQDLYAVRGGQAALLIKAAAPGTVTGCDHNPCLGAWVDPKQRYIFTISGGCVGGAVQVITVDEARTRLN